MNRSGSITADLRSAKCGAFGRKRWGLILSCIVAVVAFVWVGKIEMPYESYESDFHEILIKHVAAGKPKGSDLTNVLVQFQYREILDRDGWVWEIETFVFDGKEVRSRTVMAEYSNRTRYWLEGGGEADGDGLYFEPVLGGECEKEDVMSALRIAKGTYKMQENDCLVVYDITLNGKREVLFLANDAGEKAEEYFLYYPDTGEREKLEAPLH